MALSALAVYGYRSLRDVVIPLQQLNVIAGPETFSRAVLRGDHAVQGTTRKTPVSLRLGFAGDEFGYAIDLGLPTPSRSAFAHDPEIKRECIWHGEVLRPASLLVDRRGPVVRTRGEDGEWNILGQNLP